MVALTCQQCGVEFESKRSHAKFCGATCRQRSRRRTSTPVADELAAGDGGAQPESLMADLLTDGGVVVATKRDLEQAKKADSVAGRQALLVAARMSMLTTTGSELAALSKELSRLMYLAIGKGVAEADPIDEVKRARDKKIAKARSKEA